MSQWFMEVNVWDALGPRANGRRWKPVKTTAGQVYFYPTEADARQALNMWYPDEIYGTTVRVTEVPGV